MDELFGMGGFVGLAMALATAVMLSGCGYGVFLTITGSDPTAYTPATVFGVGGVIALGITGLWFYNMFRGA